MSIPTMKDLRLKYSQLEGSGDVPCGTEFDIECAFYWGFMNACTVMKTYLEEGTADVTTVEDMMDQMNADMAAEVGG